MSLTKTSLAPLSKTSAIWLALSPSLFFEVSVKTAPSAPASAALPGEAVTPAAVGPTQAIALQKPMTPWAIKAAAPARLWAWNAPVKAPIRLGRFAGAVTGRLAALLSAEP